MEIREKIIERIKSIDDPRILQDIYRLLSSESEPEVYEMTEGELQSVDQGIADFKNGRWFSEEEADILYEKRRNEKLNGL